MTFITFFIKNLLSKLQYRSNFIGSIVLLSIIYASKLLFIDTLFNYSDGLGGWSKTEVFFIFYLSIVVWLGTGVVDSSVYSYFRHVHAGKIDSFLVKPTNQLLTLFMRWCDPSKLIILALILPLGLLFQGAFADQSVLRWGGFFALTVFAIGLNVLFIATLNLSVFVIQRYLPVDFIVSELNRMSHLPVSLYPAKGIEVIFTLLPTVFCASIPAAYIIKDSYYLGWLMAAVFVAYAVVFRSVFYRILSKFDGLGG